MKMAIGEAFAQEIPGHSRERSSYVIVSTPERWVSALGGGFLLAYGANHYSWYRALLIVSGGGLLHSAVTDHCQLYKVLNVNTAVKTKNGVANVHHGEGIKVEHAVAIRRSAEE